MREKRSPRRRSYLTIGAASCPWGGLPFARPVLELGPRRHVVQAPGNRRREVEDAVVVAGRVADEHVAQHRLGDVRVLGVADEVRPELTRPQAAEGHVVPEDLPVVAVLVLDVVERDVGVARLLVLGQLDVGELAPTDDLLLLLGRELLPRGEVVEVFLHDDVAAAGVGRVLVSDEDGVERIVALGVLRPVDEAEQVAALKYRKPWTSSTIVAAPSRCSTTRCASAKHRSIRSARRCRSRSPGVETALCFAPSIASKVCRCAGRGTS